MKKKIVKFAILFLASILFMQFVWFLGTSNTKSKTMQSSEKVNLALRRTAHLLLKDVGDSTSLIPPIQQLNEKTWLIKIEQAFAYEKLPDFLQKSFEIQKIEQNYNVAILACNDGTLLLGYNIQDYFQNKEIPCVGRSDSKECRNIQVTFLDDLNTIPHFPILGWFFATFLATVLYYIGQRMIDKRKATSAVVNTETTFISFGQSRFDIGNQSLICGDVTHALTYREAKLLNLFVQNQNQILERSFILENVWADEGILVGRSLDMFVSRLRKMLREDPSIQLTAIHGVGYRMDVN